MSSIQLTRLAKSGGPLTKHIHLDEAGEIISDGSACVMSHGTAHRAELADPTELATLIAGLSSCEAIALGALRPDIADDAKIALKRKLNGSTRPDLIARTAEFIAYRRQQPAMALLDFDTKGMTPDVTARLDELGGFWPALVSVLPELATTARVMRRSTSSGLRNAETGAELPSSNGLHVFVAVGDGTDIERFVRTLHDRCWLAGLGWFMVGAGGQLLERSIVDRMLGAPERLIFEGAPTVDPPLVQDAESRRPIARQGSLLDTLAACAPLTIVEQTRLDVLRRKAKAMLAGEAAKGRKAFIDYQTEKLLKRTGLSKHAAAKIVRKQCSGILLPDVVLPFDDDELASTTVADVLADPTKYEGATLADPLEGVEYGHGKAKIMLRVDGSPWIHSFAHGRMIYHLRLDARAAKAALEKAEATDAADEFVRLALASDLDPAEAEKLRNQASEQSGSGKRALEQKLKAAVAERAVLRAEETRSRAAVNSDRRVWLSAPAMDAERLPITRSIDEVLCGATPARPPVRDVDQCPAEARCRPPMLLHDMLTTETNKDATDETTSAGDAANHQAR